MPLRSKLVKQLQLIVIVFDLKIISETSGYA